MIRRPPRSTRVRSSAASDVYKRQDEDFRSENASGLGIRALAQAIESEGLEVLGVTSYGDLSQFAQQQSRASAFILSIDDEEFTPGPDLDPAVVNLRAFITEAVSYTHLRA